MEALWLVASAPSAFVASSLYRFALLHGVEKRPQAGHTLLSISRIVVLALVAELALVALMGPLPLRAFVGPAYWPLHLTFFILGVPAMVNVMVLTRPGAIESRAIVVAFASAVLAAMLAFHHLHVSEALYGIDGVGGPYERW